MVNFTIYSRAPSWFPPANDAKFSFPFSLKSLNLFLLTILFSFPSLLFCIECYGIQTFCLIRRELGEAETINKDAQNYFILVLLNLACVESIEQFERRCTLCAIHFLFFQISHTIFPFCKQQENHVLLTPVPCLCNLFIVILEILCSFRFVHYFLTKSI